MGGKRLKDKSHLRLWQGFLAEGDMRDAHRSLVTRVFDLQMEGGDDGFWRVFAAFEPPALCVASLEARVLPFLIDGDRRELTGLRRVAVDPGWRGLGLVRDLMGPALAWCEAQSPHPILLYAEVPDLYTRFGFGPLPQHAFLGVAPPSEAAAPARRLDRRQRADEELILRLLGARSPVSRQCALLGAPDLAFRNILAADDLIAAYAADLQALIVYEIDDGAFTLVDVAAAKVPSMAAILGALALSPRHVTTLFPPDRLAWTGLPQIDDTGLMARGALPAAMTRPFMLPPTGEF